MRIRRSIDFATLEELQQVEGLAQDAGLSLSNFLREKINLPRMTPGGARPNNGRRDCARCRRRWNKKVKAAGEGMCGDCWEAQ